MPRISSLTTAAAVSLALLSGCGSSKPSAKAPAKTSLASALGHHTLVVSARSWSGGQTCSGGTCTNTKHFSFGLNVKLTRAQAIKAAYQMAHENSLIVHDVTCHSLNGVHQGNSVEGGWVCHYIGALPKAADGGP